jgi:hypothetical protein
MRIGNHEQFILLLEQPYKHSAIAIVFVFLRHDSTREKRKKVKRLKWHVINTILNLTMYFTFYFFFHLISEAEFGPKSVEPNETKIRR